MEVDVVAATLTVPVASPSGSSHRLSPNLYRAGSTTSTMMMMMQQHDQPMGSVVSYQPEASASASAISSGCRSDRGPYGTCRWRRKPASGLKSILRHSSSAESGSALHVHRLLTPAAVKKRRGKAVQFLLEDKPQQGGSLKSRRLRTLALDLDKLDDLPWRRAVGRPGNRHKTRHTRRLSLAAAPDEDGQPEEAAGGPDMGSPLPDKPLGPGSLRGDENETNDCLMPMAAPEVEILEKSLFIQRWLRHNRECAAALPFRPGSSCCDHLRACCQQVAVVTPPRDTTGPCPSRASSQESLTSLASGLSTLNLSAALKRQP